MNIEILKEFAEAVKSLLGNDVPEEALSSYESVSEDGESGSVTIYIDYDMIDWDVTDPEWESYRDADVQELCNEYGGSMDWQDGEIEVYFSGE